MMSRGFIKMKAETLEDIKKVVDYLFNDEEKHYEESEKPKEHIFHVVERLKDLVERFGYCDTCGGKLTALPPSLTSMNLHDEDSKICFKCGIIHTEHKEELDEEEADNYRDNYGQEEEINPDENLKELFE